MNLNKALHTATDFRMNLYQIKERVFASPIEAQSESVACLVPNYHLTDHPEGFKLADEVPTLAQRVENELKLGKGPFRKVPEQDRTAIFGEEEAFGNELSPGSGTAFLVSERHVLTSAHCVCFEDCNQLNSLLIKITRLVFGFNMKQAPSSSFIFERKDVYEIETVVAHHYGRIKAKGNYAEWNDWALLELDRKVEKRTPLCLNFNQRVANKIQIYMLGHPYGIPLKLARGCIENNNQSDFFGSNLAAFQGNSGSPVFDKETGSVVGILCSGHEDYEVTSNYRGEKRIQAHRVTDFEVGQKGFENSQRISKLRFLAEHLGLIQKKPVLKTTIIDVLIRHYQSKSTLPRLLSDPMPMDQIYTELALVHRAENSIELHQLFNELERFKHILIVGLAGIGKSTLCQHIAYQWAQGKLWNDKFEAIFWVPLGKLHTHSVENTGSFLFRYCCQEMSEEVYSSHIEDYIKENKQRVLFIFDGLDEVVLPNKIVTELMAYPYWIITSRSPRAQNIQADSIIENIGFNPSTIENYIKKVFPSNGSTIFRNISQNPTLASLCHNPIHLELICSILQQPNFKISSIHTITNLYEELTVSLQKRFLEKKEKPDPWIWEKGDIKNDPDIQSAFNLLELVAWTTLNENRPVFSFSNGTLETLYYQCPKETRGELFTSLCKTGFLESTGESRVFIDNKYFFLHSTFQEFFAAHYLSKLSYKELTPILQALQKKPESPLAITFLCGILYKNQPENIHLFFEILRPSEDNLELTFRCLNECTSFFGKIESIERLLDKPEIVDKIIPPPKKKEKIFSQGLPLAAYLAAQNLEHALRWLLDKKPGLINQNQAIFMAAVSNGNLDLMEFLLKLDKSFPSWLSFPMTLCDSYGWTPFHVAVQAGQIEAMEWLYAKAPSLLTTCNSNGRTPFHLAAGEGQVKAMEWLHDKDKSLLTKCNIIDRWTPFHFAIEKGQIAAMEWLYAKDKSLLTKSLRDGSTPFHVAIEKGQIAAMEWLYAKDRSLLTRCDSYGWTPFHVAAQASQIEAMEWLHDKDQSLLTKCTVHGWTPFHSAASSEHIRAMEWLYDKDKSLLTKCSVHGWTPFHKAVSSGHIRAMAWLYSKDQSLLTKCDNDRKAPFDIAVQRGRIEVVNWLIAKDPSFLAKCNIIDRWTPFHFAIEKGRIAAMEWLYAKDKSLLTKSLRDGLTPFHVAIKKGQIAAMEWLYAKDESLLTKSLRDGSTPFHVAAQTGQIEAMEWLHDKDESLLTKCTVHGWTPFEIAIIKGQIKAMDWLYAKDESLLTTCDSNGWSPFHVAARNGQIKAMDWLYAKDESLLTTCNSNGWTPFHSAARNGQIKAMDWLHDKDESLLTTCNSNGWTPFHSAVCGGHIEAMEWLYDQDQALLTKCTNGGLTSFHIAVREGRIKAMEWLYAKDQALLNKRTNDGSTPLDFAIQGYKVEATNWLIHRCAD